MSSRSEILGKIKSLKLEEKPLPETPDFAVSPNLAESFVRSILSNKGEIWTIQELEGKLSAAQIIDPAALDVNGRVVFGATVDLEDLEDGTKLTYQIVGDDEADIAVNKISISSPIARALISKEEGDVVAVQAPGGNREVEILAVRYI